MLQANDINNLKCLVLMSSIDGVNHIKEELFIRNLDRFKKVTDEEYQIAYTSIKNIKISDEDKISDLLMRISELSERKQLIKELSQLAAADYIFHKNEIKFLDICKKIWNENYEDEFNKIKNEIKSRQKTDSFKFICSNNNCKNEKDLSKDEIAELLEYEPNNLYEACKLYNDIECSLCRNNFFYVFNNHGSLIIDPNNIKRCDNCASPIPLPRLETFPETNVCLPSCAEKIKLKSKTPDIEYPPIPKGMENCPKCESKATVRYSEKNYDFFLSCMTFPNCWWTAPYPVITKDFTFKKEEIKIDLLAMADELVLKAKICRQNKDKQSLMQIRDELDRRISNKIAKNKRPSGAAVRGLKQIEVWIDSI